MKRYRLTISPDVERAIADQVAYIARDSIDHALAWEDRLRQAFTKIRDGAGYARDEEASIRLGFEVRRYVFEQTYLIFYRVNEEQGTIHLLGFRHGARLPRRGEP